MKKLLLALLLFPLLALGADLRVPGTFSYATQPAAGSILRSNATSWLGTTATFADTYTSGGLLFSNGANTVQGSPFITFSGTVFQFAGDNPAADLTYNVTHTGNNAASRGVISVAQGGAGGGDAVVQWTLTGLQSWTAGADISASNAWKLSAGTVLGTNDAIIVTAAGAVSGKGTATNDSASTGYIGEYIEVQLTSASEVSLSTGTVANVITTLSLTAGDWDVSGVVAFDPNAATNITYLEAGTTIVSATEGAEGSFSRTTYGSTGLVNHVAPRVIAPVTRYSLATTTTVYLIARAAFSLNTLAAYGHIRARRVR